MEPHPVPQNVTTFEFHLFGNVTFKQFGYLAVGMVIAYITFMFFRDLVPFIAYPVMIISGLLGIAYAFIPIMERPLDYWTLAFIRAISKPTLRKFQPNKYIDTEQQFKDRVNIFLAYMQQIGNTPPPPAVVQPPQPVINAQPTSPQADYNPLPIPQPLQPPVTPQAPTPNPFQPVSNPPVAPVPQQFTPTPPPAQLPNVPPPNNNQPSPVLPQQPVNDQAANNQIITPPYQPTKTEEDNLYNLGEFSPYTIVDHPANTQNQPQPATATPPHNSNEHHSPNPVSEFLSSLTNLAGEVASSMHSHHEDKPAESEAAPAQPGVSNEQLEKTVELAQEAQVVQQKIHQAEKQIEKIKKSAVPDPVNQANSMAYTQEFQSTLSELQQLNQKAQDIAHELAVLSQKPAEEVAKPAIVKPSIIPTLTLTTTPNIINGIVTDPQGNYVEGAIVVAHDKQTVPVRALKTNKLGQFIAATPLPDGVYTLTIEKEGLVFDVAQIELTGIIINPIVITAKSMAIT